MTKREFDRATKTNYGAKMGGRSDYRRFRALPVLAVDDFVTRRARLLAARNTPERVSLDGFLPTLGIASPFRATAVYRARVGLPLLDAR